MNYAGFWLRLRAGLVDAAVFIPIMIIGVWMEGFSRQIAIFEVLTTSFLYAFYNIYFHGRYGQTIGKMLVGIKVVKEDGSCISFRQAFYRHSVDLLCAIVLCLSHIIALTNISDSQYLSAVGWLNRVELLSEMRPAWAAAFDILWEIWIWSELVVLLLNKKKKALHDYIAGTVVVRLEKSS